MVRENDSFALEKFTVVCTVGLVRRYDQTRRLFGNIIAALKTLFVDISCCLQYFVSFVPRA